MSLPHKKHPEDRVDDLILQYLDGEISPVDFVSLEAEMRNDESVRRRYCKMIDLHASLHRTGWGKPWAERPRVPWTPSRHQLLAAAAVVCLTAIWTVIALSLPKRPTLVAARDAVWVGPRVGVERKFKKGTYEIVEGSLQLAFGKRNSVTLKAPCRFEIDTINGLELSWGTANVLVPDPTSDGFRVITPAADFVDRGTSFDLSCGSKDGKSMAYLDVLSGKVEIIEAGATSGTMAKSGMSAIVTTDKDGMTIEWSDGQLVQSSDSLDFDPELRQRKQEDLDIGNLALGKPVVASSYWANRPTGLVFPPDNLTDGRLNDTGVPGEWSYWLLAEKSTGYATIDLGEVHRISRVSLQNTRNERHRDRAALEVRIGVSTDNKIFKTVAKGSLKQITAEPGTGFPFESFTFTPREARYVMIEITKFHDLGGGLNEVRVFAAPK